MGSLLRRWKRRIQRKRAEDAYWRHYYWRLPLEAFVRDRLRYSNTSPMRAAPEYASMYHNLSDESLLRLAAVWHDHPEFRQKWR